MSGAGVVFTAGQLAELRAALRLPAGASERVVEAGLILALGLADALIEAVETVLASEWEYQVAASELGWTDDE